jgi:hypothetical protein
MLSKKSGDPDGVGREVFRLLFSTYEDDESGAASKDPQQGPAAQAAGPVASGEVASETPRAGAKGSREAERYEGPPHRLLPAHPW